MLKKMVVLLLVVVLAALLVPGKVRAQSRCSVVVTLKNAFYGGEGFQHLVIQELQRRGAQIVTRNFFELDDIRQEIQRQQTPEFRQRVRFGQLEGACWMMFLDFATQPINTGGWGGSGYFSVRATSLAAAMRLYSVETGELLIAHTATRFLPDGWTSSGSSNYQSYSGVSGLLGLYVVRSMASELADRAIPFLR